VGARNSGPAGAERRLGRAAAAVRRVVAVLAVGAARPPTIAPKAGATGSAVPTTSATATGDHDPVRQAGPALANIRGTATPPAPPPPRRPLRGRINRPAPAFGPPVEPAGAAGERAGRAADAKGSAAPLTTHIHLQRLTGRHDDRRDRLTPPTSSVSRRRVLR